MSKIKLYVLPASHPCVAVEAALKLKSISFDRVDLLPLTQLAVGPLRYGGNTVPGIRIDGERIVGSRAIMRRLDELEPEPALLPPPDDPAYAQVLEAERWGDEDLQPVPRRLLPRAFVLEPALMESFLADDVRLPLPRPMFEVFVYSPEVEAIHLRMAQVARGGIRWSDRPEDFRTEVLGLMKARTGTRATTAVSASLTTATGPGSGEYANTGTT